MSEGILLEDGPNAMDGREEDFHRGHQANHLGLQ